MALTACLTEPGISGEATPRSRRQTEREKKRICKMRYQNKSTKKRGDTTSGKMITNTKNTKTQTQVGQNRKMKIKIKEEEKGSSQIQILTTKSGTTAILQKI